MKKSGKKKNKSVTPSAAHPVISMADSPFFALTAVCLISLAVYSNTFTVPFQLDDFTSLTNNTAIQDITDIKALWRFCPTRFITYATFAVNYHFFQTNVFSYHVVNFGIHLGAALSVWWLTLLTLATPKTKDTEIALHKQAVAAFSALLFAAHPVQTQAVTYIVQRLASLATLLYLLSLCLYVKGRLLQKEGAAWKRILLCFGGSTLCAVTGMFTKETAFTLPVMVLCYEFYFLQIKNIFRSKYTYIALLLLCVIPLTLFLSKNLNLTQLREVQEGPEGVIYISSYQYLLTQTRVLITYLRLFFFPINQSVDHHYPVATTLLQPAVLKSLCLIIAVAAAGVWCFSRSRVISFCILWFFITLAPESSFIPIKDVMFEHRLYLPMAGYCIFVTAGSFMLLRRRHARIVRLILTILVVILSLLTYARNDIWKNDFSLWNDAALKSPGKARPFNNRGLAYSSRGEYENAISDFMHAIQINPTCAIAYYNMGLVYSLTGKYDLAIENYAKAINIYPNYSAAFNNRGLAYNHKAAFDRAIADFDQALQIKPDFAEALYNRGLSFCYKKQYERAIIDFDQAVRIKPAYAEAYYNRGLARMYKKDFRNALADFDQVIVLNPASAEAFYHRGLASASLGESDRAIASYSQALAINPDYLEAYYNRANVYGSNGKHDKTIADLNQVLRINPRSAEAYYARGVAYTYKEDYDRALADYDTALRIKPDYANAYNNRAVIHVMKKDYAKAREDLRRLQELGHPVEPRLLDLLRNAPAGDT